MVQCRCIAVNVILSANGQQIIWVCIFQYCFVRVAMTIVAVVTQVFDRYCLESLNPAFAHVWVMVIEAAAVSIAMYYIIQFYMRIFGVLHLKHCMLHGD
jgi:hypothetical protein